MIKTRPGILERLKTAGYSAYRLRKEKILGEATIQAIRAEKTISNETLDLLCRLLDCQPGDLLEYVPEESPEEGNNNLPE